MSIDKAFLDELSKLAEREQERCFRRASALVLKDPSLTLMKGPPIVPGDTAHFWVEDKSGKVIDPTKRFYPGVKYRYKGTPVSLERNLPYLKKLGLAPSNTIPFPGEYMRGLRAGTKNTTVRVGEERGRYMKGMTYEVTNMKGQPVGVRIKVTDVETMPLSGVDQRTRLGTMEMIQRKHGTQPNELVDVVRFEVLGGM